MEIFIKENIKYLSSLKNRKLKDVAKELEVSYSTFSKYTSNTIPPIEMMITIADYFEVTLDELVRYDLRKYDGETPSDEKLLENAEKLEKDNERLRKMVDDYQRMVSLLTKKE